MPIYEYKCVDCGKIIEATHKFDETGPDLCPGCNCKHLKKVMSRNTFHLKGSGWYKTDYASNEKV